MTHPFLIKALVLTWVQNRLGNQREEHQRLHISRPSIGVNPCKVSTSFKSLLITDKAVNKNILKWIWQSCNSMIGRRSYGNTEEDDIITYFKGGITFNLLVGIRPAMVRAAKSELNQYQDIFVLLCVNLLLLYSWHAFHPQHCTMQGFDDHQSWRRLPSRGRYHWERGIIETVGKLRSLYLKVSRHSWPIGPSWRTIAWTSVAQP